MHTLIVYKEDLLDSKDGDEVEEVDESRLLLLFTQKINWTPEKVVMKLANEQALVLICQTLDFRGILYITVSYEHIFKGW